MIFILLLALVFVRPHPVSLEKKTRLCERTAHDCLVRVVDGYSDNQSKARHNARGGRHPETTPTWKSAGRSRACTLHGQNELGRKPPVLALPFA
jgi:hypothetical protein